jgi:hypothetical protein
VLSKTYSPASLGNRDPLDRTAWLGPVRWQFCRVEKVADHKFTRILPALVNDEENRRRQLVTQKLLANAKVVGSPPSPSRIS